jgi:hypothetical protein
MDSQYGDSMFDSEDVFDIENVHQLPMDMVIHMKNKPDPIFAEHVFFFEKEDPVTSLEELMNFAATWWSTIIEDRNIDFIFLTDRQLNKKAILLRDIIAASFMTPEKPEWMEDGKDSRDPS